MIIDAAPIIIDAYCFWFCDIVFLDCFFGGLLDTDERRGHTAAPRVVGVSQVRQVAT